MRRRGRRSIIVLTVLACLFIAGCAGRDSSADKDQRDGFYGGVSVGGSSNGGGGSGM